MLHVQFSWLITLLAYDLLSQWLYAIQSSQLISHIGHSSAQSALSWTSIANPSAHHSENNRLVTTIHVVCCSPIRIYHKQGPMTSNMYCNYQLPMPIVPKMRCAREGHHGYLALSTVPSVAHKEPESILCDISIMWQNDTVMEAETGIHTVKY